MSVIGCKADLSGDHESKSYKISEHKIEPLNGWITTSCRHFCAHPERLIDAITDRQRLLVDEILESFLDSL